MIKWCFVVLMLKIYHRPSIHKVSTSSEKKRLVLNWF